MFALRTIVAVAAGLTLAVATPAQFQPISASFSPNPAAPGVPIMLTCRDAAGTGLNLPAPCGWYTIHSGSQTGPIVQLGQFCPQVIVPIPPNGAFSTTWDQRDDTGTLVPPGQYWWQVRVWDANFTALQIEWFCISIQGPNEPALTAAGPARVGQSTAMQIQAPLAPGAVYFVGLGFSANTPATVFGLTACVSEPIVFDFMTAPFGALDANGSSTGLSLDVPNTPLALWQGAHVQALLLGSGPPVLTNSVAFSVVP